MTESTIATQDITPNLLPEPERSLVESLLATADAIAEKMRGERDLSEDPEAYQAWRQQILAILRPVVTGMIATMPEPPLADRERHHSISDLIGEEHPVQLDEHDLGQALSTLNDARQILPLDEDEEDIFDQIQRAYSFVSEEISSYEQVCREDEVDEVLNNDLQNYRLPEWMEDIDWDSIYDRIKYNASSVEFNSYTYFAIRVT